MNRVSIGREGEEYACAYLESRGLQILQRNYQIRGGEIDIIAKEGGTTVFVEVKLRNGNRFGTGAEAITQKKRAALLRAATRYAYENHLLDTPMRFDVIEIFNRNVRHYVNALEE